MNERGNGESGRRKPQVAVLIRAGGLDGATPVIAGIGAGALAEELVTRAADAGVPVLQEPALAEELLQFQPAGRPGGCPGAVGLGIPAEFLSVVSELLAYLEEVHEDWKAKNQIRR